MEGDHHTLLLKGPEKQSDGVYQVLIYNPSNNAEEYETVPITEDFQSFRERELRILQQNYDKENRRYNLSNDVYVPEGMVDQHLYNEWFKLPNGRRLSSNDLGQRQLTSGQYDLSILEDTELPQELKLGKSQRFQFNGWDCGPLSLYTAVLRYAAKPGNEEEKQKLVLQFERDFGVPIFTRRELLGGSKDKVPAGTEVRG